jgi:site-specific DNA-methyltransferase (adenine-specific)
MAGRGFGGKNQPMIDPKKSSIHKGDCLELMKEIPAGSIDMILCDLPYGTTACKWDTIIPFDPLWAQYKRIIKHNGAIVLFGSEPFTSALVMSNTKDFKYRWTWNKIKASNHLNSRRQPLRCIEDICVFYKKQPTYNPQLRDRLKKNIRDPKKEYGKGNNKTYGETKQNYLFNSGREIPLEKGYPLDLLEFSQLGSFGNKRVHPTQKPVPLFEYLIKTYTNEGETVLDNCAGSFTTAIACLNTERKYICMEQEGEYFALGENRITEWHKAAAEDIFKSK